MPRWLINRGWTLNRGRKTTMLVAPLHAAAVLRHHAGAGPGLTVALVTGMLLCHTIWLNVALPARCCRRMSSGRRPARRCLGALAGVATQQLIGWTVQNVSFAPVFGACAVVHLTGLALVCWLVVGELGVVQEVK